MAEIESNYREEQMQSFRKPVEDEMIPVTNDQQLGQDILRTFARISDPDTIQWMQMKIQVPILKKKEVIGEDGKKQMVEVIGGWKVVDWKEPIRVQPEYHELITDDVSRAFLDDDDLSIYRANASYCKTLKSFAVRYELNLAIHHNNFADENCLLLVSSGAHKGKRVQLAKTNLIETNYKQDVSQIMEQRPPQQKKKGLLGSLGI